MLLFHGEYIQDDDFDEDESGFSASTHGDSGGALFAEINDYHQNAILAIQSNIKSKQITNYLKGMQYKCRAQGTKVTEELIEWILRVHKRYLTNP